MDTLQDRFLTRTPGARENVVVEQVVFDQSNSALQDLDIAETMANFAMAAAADRTIVATLSTTIDCLSAELAIASAALVTSLATIVTLTASLTGGGGRVFGGHGFEGQSCGGRGDTGG